MGDSHREFPRRSERITKAKRPHHLSEFMVGDFEPVEKSPRLQEQHLANSTMQDQQEALKSIQTLIVELSTGQRDIVNKIQLNHSERTTQLNSTENKFNNKVKELSNLIESTNKALTVKVDELHKELSAIREKVDASHTQANTPIAAGRTCEASENASGSNVPLSRSSSTLSVNSVESVEMITRQISQTISSALGSHKKLIALPKFNGDADKWPQFLAQFERTTSRENYSTEDNVTRLEQALEGKAKDLVSSLLIHHTNVPQIIDRLRSRFGLPEQLVETQLIAIRKFENIQDDQIQKIVPFADKVMNLKNFLESAGCVEHLNSPSLLKELESKLPYRERLTWGGYSMSLRPPTVKEFSDWLSILADQIHRMNLRDGNDQKKKAKLYHISKELPLCCLCNISHDLPDCEIFLSMRYEEKWKTVKIQHLCFHCLKPGHHIFHCKLTSICGIDDCKAKHHKLLHNQTKHSPHPNAKSTKPASLLSCQNHSVNVLFKILPVKLIGPKGSLLTYALIDEGSNITMMNEEVANSIGASGPKMKLHLSWVGNMGSDEDAMLTNVNISGTFPGASEFTLSGVHVVSDLKLPKQTLDLSKLSPKFKFENNFPIQEFENVTPTTLIGLDNSHLGAARNRQSSQYGPIVCSTKLGYVVYGPVDVSSIEECGNKARVHLVKSDIQIKQDLHELVKVHFSTEDFGVKHLQPLNSKDDEKATQIMQTTTKRLNGQFESGLIWKYNKPNLPNNYFMALKRLESCERKMKKDNHYAAAYKKTMTEYFNKGYAKTLSTFEINNPKGPVWYLPHFGIINPNKNKFRLVFDAAAEFKGVSLNSKLLSGPDNNQPLIKILSLFREKRIAVCADIREMFHQIKIREQDKDAQRFLYRNDPNESVRVCRMEVMTFGSTCSPATAQHVKNMNAQNFMTTKRVAATAIINKHYVDDYVDCFHTEAEAIETSRDVRFIHMEAGFELRGFTSNSEKVSRALRESEDLETVKRNLDNGANDKILGLSWNVQEDCFTFDIKLNKIDTELLEGLRCPTKREYLSTVMSIFDPFGFVADFMITTKILLQRIWKSGTQWDETIPEEYQSSWLSWIKDLQNLQHFRIPRCMSNNIFQASRIEWHTWSTLAS